MGGVTTLNGNLVLRQHNALAHRTFYSFCGMRRVDETAETLLRVAAEEGITPGLRLIPDNEAIALAQCGFSVAPDRDSFDYVFDTQRIAELQGNAFQTKRTQANRFARLHPHVFKALDLTDRHIQRAMLELREHESMRNGVVLKTTTSQLWTNGADADWPALECMLSMAQHFKLVAIGLFVKERLIAFSIAELGSDGLAFLHFLKSNWSEFPGCTVVILRETARLLRAHGATRFNYGSDDGVSGIRTNKQRYKPLGFVQKFTVCAPGTINK